MNNKQKSNQITKGNISPTSLMALILILPALYGSHFLLKNNENHQGKYGFVSKDKMHQVSEDLDVKNGEFFIITDRIESNNTILKDPRYGVKIDALKLHRKSYTYLWVEKKLKDKKKPIYVPNKNENRSYEYRREWIPDNYDGSSIRSKNTISKYFKEKEGHQNPRVVKLDTVIEHPDRIKIGDFYLGDTLYNSLQDYSLVRFNESHLPENHSYIFDMVSKPVCPKLGSELNYAGSFVGSEKKLSSTSSIFIGKGTPRFPKVGDKRIEYWKVKRDTFTIVGAKLDNKIVAVKSDSSYIRSRCACGRVKYDGGFFGFIFSGKHTLEEVFQSNKSSRGLSANILRFIGFLIMLYAILGSVNISNYILDSFTNYSFKTKLKITNGLFLAAFYVPLSISTFYFLKYNSISNLTIYDIYFPILLIACILLTYGVLKYDYDRESF